MTGMSQLTAKVNEQTAEELETDTFEITWHGGARPSHWWGGKWYTKAELISVCGLGTVTGLCGANCYHDYYPVIPGVSEPTYTQEELNELNAKQQEKKDWRGKEYTQYKATQRQRRLETTMRAQRQEIKLLKGGGADEDSLIEARARYRKTSDEYERFSKAMDIPQQRERVTVDGLGNVGQGKYKILTNEEKQDILKNKIAKGDITKTLFEPKQSPHILGSPRYDESQKKSYFTISQDAIQEIVDNKFATGEVLIKRSGQIKEIIEIPEGIAYILDEDGNNLGTTNRATIHYSKSRTHIVPARRGDDNNA